MKEQDVSPIFPGEKKSSETAHSTVVLDKSLILRLLDRLSHTADEGPAGPSWQSEELQSIIAQLKNALREDSALEKSTR
jgi:hypothetical protein